MLTCVNIYRAALFVHFPACSFTSIKTEQVKKLKMEICTMTEVLSLGFRGQ